MSGQSSFKQRARRTHVDELHKLGPLLLQPLTDPNLEPLSSHVPYTSLCLPPRRHEDGLRAAKAALLFPALDDAPGDPMPRLDEIVETLDGRVAILPVLLLLGDTSGVASVRFEELRAVDVVRIDELDRGVGNTRDDATAVFLQGSRERIGEITSEISQR
jgi:hypothetical protein